MNVRLRVALGNILVGFGAGALFPGKPDARLIFALDFAGLGLIVGASHRLREVPAQRAGE